MMVWRRAPPSARWVPMVCRSRWALTSVDPDRRPARPRRRRCGRCRSTESERSEPRSWRCFVGASTRARWARPGSEQMIKNRVSCHAHGAGISGSENGSTLHSVIHSVGMPSRGTLAVMASENLPCRSIRSTHPAPCERRRRPLRTQDPSTGENPPVPDRVPAQLLGLCQHRHRPERAALVVWVRMTINGYPEEVLADDRVRPAPARSRLGPPSRSASTRPSRRHDGCCAGTGGGTTLPSTGGG
jgi:hypothetical protein